VTVNTLMNEAALLNWMLRRLGAPLLKVELTQCHFEDNISDAKHWFSAKKGVKKQKIMRTVPGQVEYQLDDEVDTVLDIAFSVPPMDISTVFYPFAQQGESIPYNAFMAPGSGGLYSSYTQTLMYVETAKRVLGAEPDWRQEGRKLYLFPVPKNDNGIWMDYKANIITIEQLNERDHDLVKRYALAKAKADLAEIRGKYDSYPGAQGSTTLNSAILRESALAEIEKLDEEIILSGYPLGFTTG
jgi:hypothetical protein